MTFEEQRISSQDALRNRTHYSGSNKKSLQSVAKRNKVFGKSPIALTDGSGGYILNKGGNVLVSELDEYSMQQIANTLKGKYIHSNTPKFRNAADITRIKRWEERFKYIIGFAVFLLIIEVISRRRSRP